MRQFPHAVRRAVIDGVAPPDMALPASASLDNQTAFDALLGACEQDAFCAKAYPRLRLDWATVLARLPKPVVLTHPLSGTPEHLTMTREVLLEAVRGPLYAPVMASALPRAITEAAQDHFDALLGLGTLSGGRGPNRMAMGLHLSVLCAEDMPRLATSRDLPGKDFAAEFGRLYATACAYWPIGTVAAAFYVVPPSPAPVLLLSGGLDPVTPPRHGARVAQALGAKAQHVVVANAGHGVLSLGCMSEVLFRFIDVVDDAAAIAVDASCAKNIPRPLVFVPVALAP
jgi:pimeloyl-ACP methyl ester carboxylesterase